MVPGMVIDIGDQRIELLPAPANCEQLRRGQHNLEVEAAAELQRTGTLRRRVPRAKAGDIPESSTTNRHVRVGCKYRVIEKIERLEANLELAFAVYVDGPEEACIEDRHSGSAELVAPGVGQRGWSIAGVPGNAGRGLSWIRE